jgi:hypothetical protein
MYFALDIYVIIKVEIVSDKWYFKFWAYSNIYIDENYQLYIKEVEKFIEDDELDLERVVYLIHHKPDIIDDWEITLRPTENQALRNLFQQALKADILRLSYVVSQD